MILKAVIFIIAVIVLLIFVEQAKKYILRKKSVKTGFKPVSEKSKSLSSHEVRGIELNPYKGPTIYDGSPEFHPHKHTTQTYAAQNRAAKQRRKSH